MTRMRTQSGWVAQQRLLPDGFSYLAAIALVVVPIPAFHNHRRRHDREFVPSVVRAASGGRTNNLPMGGPSKGRAR
jgi:hypothetical protein